jgi:hypothetical protein
MKMERIMSPMSELNSLIQELTKISDMYFDGHFTIIRFTTNWRVGFTVPESREDIEKMAAGETLKQAIDRCLIQFRLDEI